MHTRGIFKRLCRLWLLLVGLLLLNVCGRLEVGFEPITPMPTAATSVPVIGTVVEPKPSAVSPTQPARATPVATTGWVRKRFGSAWDIAYPEGWEVNDAGAYEGNISLKGMYDDHTYTIDLGYPILGESLDTLTLGVWVDRDLASLLAEQRKNIKIVDISLAGVAAKKVLNMPEIIYDDGTTRKYSEKLTHRIYIWRKDNGSPRTVTIAQVDSRPFDAAKMEALLDRFLAEVH